jgi:hypothetical protein
MMVASGRHREWLATLALVLIMLGAVTSRADASPLRQLAGSTTSFATDGIRYAAWQDSPVSPIVILDTYTGSRREIKAPGCVLENEAPREDPEVIAGGGRFLLSCFEELRNGCFVALGHYLLRCGEKLGEETTGEKESRQQVQRLLYARTGASILCSSSQICNRLNPPTVTKPVCQALRAKIRKAEATGGEFVYRGGVFVRPTHNYRNVRLERCHGHPLILPGPSEPTRHVTLIGPGHQKTTKALSPGEPNNFDPRYGLLTWSNGFDPTSSSPFEEATEYGTLTSYELASGERRTWKLPSIPLYTGEEPPPSGVFGYSAHTVNTVFWIAARDMTGGEAGLCCVETSYLYAARF